MLPIEILVVSMVTELQIRMQMFFFQNVAITFPIA